MVTLIRGIWHIWEAALLGGARLVFTEATAVEARGNLKGAAELFLPRHALCGSQPLSFRFNQLRMASN